ALDYTDPAGTTLTRTVLSDPGGAFTDSFAPYAVGNWTVRGIWQGDLDHSSAVSNQLLLQVGQATGTPPQPPPPQPPPPANPGATFGGVVTLQGRSPTTPQGIGFGIVSIGLSSPSAPTFYVRNSADGSFSFTGI